MYLGLHSKLSELEPERPQQPGIVPVNRAVERRNHYIAEHLGKTEAKDSRPDGAAEKATMLGWLAGQETEIRKGVAQRDPARLLS
jgi:hypothetical protein